MENSLIPNQGNYRDLLSFKKTDVIFQMTYFFCHKFLCKGDRTIDQMIQAARSGKQNIIEGSSASSTSAKTEIKLLNVAKASLKELLADYEDYLVTRGFAQWQKGSNEYETMRNLGSYCSIRLIICFTASCSAFRMTLSRTEASLNECPHSVARIAVIERQQLGNCYP